MCLSTAYINEKSDDRIAARYVSSIDIDGKTITLTDVIGTKTELKGTISYVDLTGGVVIIKAN